MPVPPLLALALLSFAAAPAALPARPTPVHPAPAAPAPAAPWADPTIDALTAQLRTALLEHVDAEQDALLRSLRQLRDPGLRALFAQIAASDRAVLRIHGVLGLAELETPPRIDLLLVKRLHDPREQLVVLGEALRAGMLPAGQLEDVARWPGLDPALVVLVLGRLQRAGVNVDPAALDPFISGQDEAAAVFAALERRERATDITVGGGPTPADAVLERFLALPRGGEPSDEMIAAILRYIRQERLARSASFARRIVEDVGNPAAEALRVEALRALLTVAPADPATFDAFRSRFEAADAAARIDLALIALNAVVEQPLLPPDLAGPPAPALPPELFGLLRAGSDPMLARIAAAGEAAVLGCTPATLGPVIELVAHPHPTTTAWAVRLANLCRGEEGLALHLAVLGAWIAQPTEDPDLLGAAVAAGAAIAESRPAALLTPLADAIADEDISAQRIILAGALRATNPAAGLLGQPRPPLGPLGADPLVGAMGTLLRTRHTEALTEDDFSVLCAIALGQEAQGQDPGEIPEALRVQAAWLALRCRGQQRIALARVLAAEAPRVDPPQ